MHASHSAAFQFSQLQQMTAVQLWQVELQRPSPRRTTLTTSFFQSELRRLRAVLHEVKLRPPQTYLRLHVFCCCSISNTYQRLSAAAAAHDALQREALEGQASSRAPVKIKRKSTASK